MNKKLIDLYKEWMEEEKLPDCGLCFSLKGIYLSTFIELFSAGKHNEGYWAADKPALAGIATGTAIFKFGKIRQTIVLLICAMHNEL